MEVAYAEVLGIWTWISGGALSCRQQHESDGPEQFAAHKTLHSAQSLCLPQVEKSLFIAVGLVLGWVYIRHAHTGLLSGSR